MAYKILQKNNKRLRKVSEPISNIDFTISKLAQNMIIAMKKENGIGLAAPQVGENVRLIIVLVKGNPLIMANPEIITASAEKVEEVESCLSIRGESGVVERFKEVTVSYEDLKGKENLLQLGGLESRCVQHEIDHLDGILFIDKVLGRKI